MGTGLSPKNNPWCTDLDNGSGGTDLDWRWRKSEGWMAGHLCVSLLCFFLPCPPPTRTRSLTLSSCRRWLPQKCLWTGDNPFCKPCPSAPGEACLAPCPPFHTAPPLPGSLPRLTENLPFLICPSQGPCVGRGISVLFTDEVTEPTEVTPSPHFHLVRGRAGSKVRPGSSLGVDGDWGRGACRGVPPTQPGL